MGVTENKSSTAEEKQRLIPKLTAESQNGDTAAKAETQAERMDRINKVTF